MTANAVVDRAVAAAVAAERVRIAARMRAQRDVLLMSDGGVVDADATLAVASLLTTLANQLDPPPPAP